MSRADGYPGFSAYGFNFARQPREMDLSLTYRALASGELDIIAGNETDGLIAALDLFQLEDDRHYFPPYQAVFIARGDVPAVLNEVLEKLAGAISTDEMRQLNYEVDGNKRTPERGRGGMGEREKFWILDFGLEEILTFLRFKKPAGPNREKTPFLPEEGRQPPSVDGVVRLFSSNPQSEIPIRNRLTRQTPVTLF